MAKKLYLIPNGIASGSYPEGLTGYSDILGGCKHFLVENERAACRLLKKINPGIDFNECVFFKLSEQTFKKELAGFLRENQEADLGIISEAGCPCVADPGSDAVFWAHQNGFEVIPLEGPSSIILSLMASGLSGQNFAFVGYLPKEKDKRIQNIKMLEKRAKAESQTQIFMEAPYRNRVLFSDIISCCSAKTILCVASDIMSEGQFIKTQDIASWKKANPPIHKKPTLFLLGA